MFFTPVLPRGRKNMQDGTSDGEIPKFDVAAYDKDLVKPLRETSSPGTQVFTGESVIFLNHSCGEGCS